jgi:hypothetical protein
LGKWFKAFFNLMVQTPSMSSDKKRPSFWDSLSIFISPDNYLFHFLDNGAECSGIVHRKVGKDFAVDFDVGTLQQAHKLGVGETFSTNCSIDTLNPKCAE